MGILSWIVMGLIADVLAKWIMPGKQPGGINGCHSHAMEARWTSHRDTHITNSTKKKPYRTVACLAQRSPGA